MLPVCPSPVIRFADELGQGIAGIETAVGNTYWVYYISTRLHPRKLRHALLFALAGWFSADFFFFFLSFNLVERKESSCCTIDQEKNRAPYCVCIYLFIPFSRKFTVTPSLWSKLSDVPFCPEFLT